MLTSSIDSLCAIKAQRCSSQLLLVWSSMALMFATVTKWCLWNYIPVSIICNLFFCLNGTDVEFGLYCVVLKTFI